MPSNVLSFSERQKREKEYYNQYARQFDFSKKVDFAPVEGKESRPWNSYWAIYEIVRKNFKEGSVLLDFGSGPGENALRFVHLGYEVKGFDISEANVFIAQKLFRKHNKESFASFQVSTAEDLPYQDDSFDIVAGIDILHHIDIKRSLDQCRRVLRPGGVAIFREPIEAPFLDFLRRTRLVRFFAPKEKSFDLHITEDERKLTQFDLKIIKSVFPKMRVKRYFLLARFDKFFREGSEPHPSFLERIDHALMKGIPFLKYFGGVVILILQKERLDGKK